jgi:beta-1,4-mannosyl-glycoprotein beta-1,4-N-acetylglucosaminyltransferase
MKIYDCFNFFNEYDILEIRLNILYDYVYKFVIVESNKTHSGIPKPYNFEENIERYSKFLDKIIYIKLDNVPDDFSNLQKNEDIIYNNIVDLINTTTCFNKYTQPFYGRDFFQKEAIKYGLVDCEDDDIILSSDCDEIPNPEIFNTILNYDIFYGLKQITYYYYINNLKEKDWIGTRMGKFKYLKDYSFNELRLFNKNIIENGGWQFSYIGDVDFIKTKIKSYSAQEFNNQYILSNIENNLKYNIDPLGRGNLIKVKIDESYPKFILNNLEKYQHLIF